PVSLRRVLPPPPSFPTRRSSDLSGRASERFPQCDPPRLLDLGAGVRGAHPKCLLREYRGDPRLRVPLHQAFGPPRTGWPVSQRRDRKSTRLNSSHVKISYAVFCL